MVHKFCIFCFFSIFKLHKLDTQSCNRVFFFVFSELMRLIQSIRMESERSFLIKQTNYKSMASLKIHEIRRLFNSKNHELNHFFRRAYQRLVPI